MKLIKTVKKACLDLLTFIRESAFIRWQTEGFTFAQWLELHDRPSASRRLKNLALAKMAELARSFEEWLEVHQRASRENSELEELALEKLAKLAQNFDQWLKLCSLSSAGSELEKLTLEKLVALQPSFEQWVEVFKYDSAGFKLKKLALEKLAGLAQNFKQCLEVHDLSLEADWPKVLALEDLANSYQIFKGVTEIYGLMLTGNKREKVSELVQNLRLSLNVYKRASVGSNLERQALERLVRLTQSLDTLIGETKGDSGSNFFKKHWLYKLTVTRRELVQWLNKHELSSVAGKLKELSLERMAELAQSFEEWFEISFRASAGSPMKRLADEKIRETVSGS